MTQLKTLNDMGSITHLIRNTTDHFDLKYIDEVELRREAIKHIKELRKGNFLSISNGLPSTDKNSIIFSDADKKALILYIKWKNNITEEDLK